VDVARLPSRWAVEHPVGLLHSSYSNGFGKLWYYYRAIGVDLGPQARVTPKNPTDCDLSRGV